MLKQFWNDEAGFIVSAELILIATLLVVGLIVGLVEVQSAVVGELNDVGEAVGRLNQSYYYSGSTSFKSGWGGRWGYGGGRVKAFTTGSAFSDGIDDCDFNECALACSLPLAESPKGVRYGHGGWGHHHHHAGPSCAVWDDEVHRDKGPEKKEKRGER